jgi:hypothetical protein
MASLTVGAFSTSAAIFAVATSNAVSAIKATIAFDTLVAHFAINAVPASTVIRMSFPLGIGFREFNGNPANLLVFSLIELCAVFIYNSHCCFSSTGFTIFFSSRNNLVAASTLVRLVWAAVFVARNSIHYNDSALAAAYPYKLLVLIKSG